MFQRGVLGLLYQLLSVGANLIYSEDLGPCSYSYEFQRNGSHCWTEIIPKDPPDDCQIVPWKSELYKCSREETQSPFVLTTTGHGDWFYDDHSLLIHLGTTCFKEMTPYPMKVFGAASFSWASQVFVCGGRLDLMWNIIGQCFHFAESSAKWISRASLLLPRFLSESTSLNNGTNTLISGGYTPQGFTRSSEVWDGTSWNWGELALPIPLYGHCLVELDPFRLLLSGGFTIDSKPSQQSWIYDRVGKIWKSLEPWPIVLNRVGTASKCIKMLDGKILLLGGGTTTALMFEPHTEQWFQMQPVPVECDAPLMVRYQKDVHLIGGCGDMRSIYRLDHSTNQWLDMGPVSEFRMNNLAGARVPQTFQHDSSC